VPDVGDRQVVQRECQVCPGGRSERALKRAIDLERYVVAREAHGFEPHLIARNGDHAGQLGALRVEGTQLPGCRRAGGAVQVEADEIHLQLSAARLGGLEHHDPAQPAAQLGHRAVVSQVGDQGGQLELGGGECQAQGPGASLSAVPLEGAEIRIAPAQPSAQPEAGVAHERSALDLALDMIDHEGGGGVGLDRGIDPLDPPVSKLEGVRHTVACQELPASALERDQRSQQLLGVRKRRLALRLALVERTAEGLGRPDTGGIPGNAQDHAIQQDAAQP
jgi:hypothetical protein